MILSHTGSLSSVDGEVILFIKITFEFCINFTRKSWALVYVRFWFVLVFGCVFRLLADFAVPLEKPLWQGLDLHQHWWHPPRYQSFSDVKHLWREGRNTSLISVVLHGLQYNTWLVVWDSRLPSENWRNLVSFHGTVSPVVHHLPTFGPATMCSDSKVIHFLFYLLYTATTLFSETTAWEFAAKIQQDIQLPFSQN